MTELIAADLLLSGTESAHQYPCPAGTRGVDGVAGVANRTSKANSQWSKTVVI
jgi:hypothetical protein